jgi:hypothetical protein
MRLIRFGVVAAAALATAGCDKIQDAFRSGGSAAATAGSLKLAPEVLGDILGSAQGVTLNEESANLVANVWVDYALFGDAIAGKTDLKDSATAAAALWPTLSEIKARRWHDTLMAQRVPVTDAAIDSAYNGDTRVLQHILVAPVNGDKAGARAKAQALLTQISGGADFAKLAGENSADPGSARDGGFLPPSGKGAFVPPFEKAGWALAPGAVSGLVETEFGFHIIRRPALAEVQDRLAASVRRPLLATADSAYMADLIRDTKLEVKSDAAGRVRAAVGDPAQGRATTAVATFTGGELTLKRLMQWVGTAPPQLAQQLKAANDSQVVGFVRMVAQNELIVRQADSAKVQPSAEEWKALYDAYTAEIDSVTAALGLVGVASKDDAAKRVQAYFEKLAIGEARLHPLPQALPMVLREKARWRINPAGITKALEIARAVQARKGTAPQGPLQQAPGGPPVGDAEGGEAPAPAPTPAPGN